MDNKQAFSTREIEVESEKEIKCKYDACFNVLALSCKRGELRDRGKK